MAPRDWMALPVRRLAPLVELGIRNDVRTDDEHDSLLFAAHLLDLDPVARELCGWVDAVRSSWTAKPCTGCPEGARALLPKDWAADRCPTCLTLAEMERGLR